MVGGTCPRYEDSVKCSHFKRLQVLFKYPSYRLSAHGSYHHIIVQLRQSIFLCTRTNLDCCTYSCSKSHRPPRQRSEMPDRYEPYDSELHAHHTTSPALQRYPCAREDSPQSKPSPKVTHHASALGGGGGWEREREMG